MASFNIHLAIAKRYIDKNNISDKEAFYNGSVDPDLAINDNISHYTDTNRNKELLIPYLQKKTILPDYLRENKIDSDYNKGFFLHLVTDYLFFNEFFDNDYLSNIKYDDFVRDLYYSYDFTNEYLENKYNLDLKQFNDKINVSLDKSINASNSKNILDFNKLDTFIEKVSDIDLIGYKDKLLTNGINIKP